MKTEGVNFSHRPADQISLGSSHLIIGKLLTCCCAKMDQLSFSIRAIRAVFIAAPAPYDKWRNKNSVSFDVMCMTVTYFCAFVPSNITDILNGKSVSGFLNSKQSDFGDFVTPDRLLCLCEPEWCAHCAVAINLDSLEANQAQNEGGTQKASFTRLICWKQVTWIKGLIKACLPD